MAINTYATLQTALDNWLGDTLTQVRSPDLITLFEAEANRTLRVRQQVASTNLTMSGGAATIPTDYLEWLRVTRLSTIPQNVQWTEPSFLQIIYPDQVQQIYPPAYAIPSAFFTIEGSNLYIRPKDDSSQVQFVYYQTIPALSDTNTTNWLLTAHPDLYLNGALTEAMVYRINDERAPLFKARRDDIFERINDLYLANTGTGAMQVNSPTP